MLLMAIIIVYHVTPAAKNALGPLQHVPVAIVACYCQNMIIHVEARVHMERLCTVHRQEHVKYAVLVVIHAKIAHHSAHHVRKD